MKYGFTKVAAAIPTVTVADCAANTREILDLMAAAHRKGAALTVFPELNTSEHPPGQLRQRFRLQRVPFRFADG